MRRFAGLLLFLSVLALAASARGEDVKSLPAKESRWAVIIGVDRYDDPQIAPLGGAANDARTLRDALISSAGFPADQVTLLASGEPRERLPTRINILKNIANVTALVPKNGLFLLAFSGHGIDKKGNAYMLPSDAYIHEDEQLLSETAVRLQWINDQIKSHRVSQVLLLLDMCRNDPAAGRADAPNKLSESYTRALQFDTRNSDVVAFATMYATSVGDRAYEYTERQQGYFTWAIVDGLRGAAANDRGEVTLGRLLTYVQDTVPKRVAIDIGGGRRQRPFATIDGYRADDLVLAYASRPAATVPPPAAPVQIVTADPRLFLPPTNGSKPDSPAPTLTVREKPRIAVVASGKDAVLAEAMEQEMERRLAAYGGSDERADPDIAALLEQPDFSKALNPALAKAGFNILVLVRVDNVREDGDGISNATLRLHAFRLPGGQTIGPGWTERIEYAEPSVSEKAREAFVGATADLRRHLDAANAQP